MWDSCSCPPSYERQPLFQRVGGSGGFPDAPESVLQRRKDLRAFSRMTWAPMEGVVLTEFAPLDLLRAPRPGNTGWWRPRVPFRVVGVGAHMMRFDGTTSRHSR